MGWLYLIRCRTTGDYYLGATTREIRLRFNEHQTQLRRGVCSVPLLQAAHDTHGMGSLDFVPLRQFPDDVLHLREREAIETLKPTLNVDGSLASRKPYERWPEIEVDGQTMTMEAAARRYGLVCQTIRARYRRGLRGDALVATAYQAPRKANRGWYSRKK